MVPVLFQMECKYDKGIGKAYLYDEAHSVFADEKEYLIGAKPWRVKAVEKRKEKIKNRELNITLIKLKSWLNM